MVSARAGINGAPAWSPDGKKLALTLSGSNGNLDIYLLDLAIAAAHAAHRRSGHRHRSRRSRPMAARIYFTSDRSGSPQIYRLDARQHRAADAASRSPAPTMRGRASRPTASSSRVLTLDDGAYRIGVQDLASGTVQVLSKGRQEESPSFAPNGAMLIFAGRERGQGVLQTVSIDGQTSVAARCRRG